MKKLSVLAVTLVTLVALVVLVASVSSVQVQAQAVQSSSQQPKPSPRAVRAGVPASWETLLGDIEARTDFTLAQKQTMMHALEDARSEYQDAAKKFSVNHSGEIKRAREIHIARGKRGDTSPFTDEEAAEMKSLNASVSVDSKSLAIARTNFYTIIVKTLPTDMLIALLQDTYVM